MIVTFSHYPVLLIKGDTDCCIPSVDRVVLGMAWEEVILPSCAVVKISFPQMNTQVLSILTLVIIYKAQIHCNTTIIIMIIECVH